MLKDILIKGTSEGGAGILRNSFFFSLGFLLLFLVIFFCKWLVYIGIDIDIMARVGKLINKIAFPIIIIIYFFSNGISHLYYRMMLFLLFSARYAAEIRETRVGVVTCGPTVLIDEVCDLARSPVYVNDKDLKRPRSQGHTMGQAQDKEPVAFDVHSEVFDF